MRLLKYVIPVVTFGGVWILWAILFGDLEGWRLVVSIVAGWVVAFYSTVPLANWLHGRDRLGRPRTKEAQERDNEWRPRG